MLTDFQNPFIDRLSNKFLMKHWLDIPPHLKRVATLKCLCLKSHAPELSEVKFHARLSRSKQLLKNVHPVTLASFCSVLTTTYLQRQRQKTRRMTDFTHIHQYKERRRDKTPAHFIDVQSLMASVGESQLTSGWCYIPLILVDHGVNVNEDYYS